MNQYASQLIAIVVWYESVFGQLPKHELAFYVPVGWIDELKAENDIVANWDFNPTNSQFAGILVIEDPHRYAPVLEKKRLKNHPIFNNVAVDPFKSSAT